MQLFIDISFIVAAIEWRKEKSCLGFSLLNMEILKNCNIIIAYQSWLITAAADELWKWVILG